MPFMDEAEDGAEEDVEDTEDEPTSLIALFLKKTKIKVFFMEKKGQQWPLLLLLDSISKAIIREVLTEIPNLPCSYTSQYKEKWHFRNKTFF